MKNYKKMPEYIKAFENTNLNPSWTTRGSTSFYGNSLCRDDRRNYHHQTGPP